MSSKRLLHVLLTFAFSILKNETYQLSSHRKRARYDSGEDLIDPSDMFSGGGAGMNIDPTMLFNMMGGGGGGGFNFSGGSPFGGGSPHSHSFGGSSGFGGMGGGSFPGGFGGAPGGQQRGRGHSHGFPFG